MKFYTYGVPSNKPLPLASRYFLFLNTALFRGGCPVLDALLVEGAFWQRYYESELR